MNTCQKSESFAVTMAENKDKQNHHIFFYLSHFLSQIQSFIWIVHPAPEKGNPEVFNLFYVK